MLNRKANYFLGTQFNDQSQHVRLKAATHGATFKQHVESNMFPKSFPRQQVESNLLTKSCPKVVTGNKLLLTCCFPYVYQKLPKSFHRQQIGFNMFKATRLKQLAAYNNFWATFGQHIVSNMFGVIC